MPSTRQTTSSMTTATLDFMRRQNCLPRGALARRRVRLHWTATRAGRTTRVARTILLSRFTHLHLRHAIARCGARDDAAQCDALSAGAAAALHFRTTLSPHAV